MQSSNSFFFFLNPKSASLKRKESKKGKNKPLQTQSLNNLFPHKKPKSSKIQNRAATYPSKLTASNLEKLQHLHCRQQRLVFLSLASFHDSWRQLPSDYLHDSIIILPKVYSEWITIADPSKRRNVPKQTQKLLADKVFFKMLQWKQEQSLLFCMNNTVKTVISWKLIPNALIAPFWCYLSKCLSQLPNPSTYKTSNHNPLILDCAWYKDETVYHSKYDVPAKSITSALQTNVEQNVRVIKEILHQSNPSLTCITSVHEINAIISNNNAVLYDNISSVMDELFDAKSTLSQQSVVEKENGKGKEHLKVSVINNLMDNLSFNQAFGISENTDYDANASVIDADGFYICQTYGSYKSPVPKADVNQYFTDAYADLSSVPMTEIAANFTI